MIPFLLLPSFLPPFLFLLPPYLASESNRISNSRHLAFYHGPRFVFRLSFGKAEALMIFTTALR
jgi:hypothetical protein